MKISKLILICSLSSLANAAFADPILISCSFDSDKVTYRPKVEFDDQNPRTISVDGKPIYYNSYTNAFDILQTRTMDLDDASEMAALYNKNNFYEYWSYLVE